MFLDLGMPGIDGYEVARRIRGRSDAGGTSLIALTGWGQEKDRQLSRAAGFKHHLVKPVDLAAMQAVLASVDR
jgi:CheY-like chemotaxis protein